MTTQPIDIKALRKLAEAATPGPWNNVGVSGMADKKIRCVPAKDIQALDANLLPAMRGEIASVLAFQGTFPRNNFALSNAAYIAAANPATMLTLVDALETAAEALRFYGDGRASGLISGVEYDEESKADRFIGLKARAALSRLAELGVG